MKKRFEYKTLVIEPKGFWSTRFEPSDIDNDLNKLGMDGWELVSVESRNWGQGSTSSFFYTFKREI